jgi:secondary thiamine-phosphate synthase enzyme
VTVHQGELGVKTTARVQTVDVTDLVAAAVKESGIANGMCTVTVAHTTAGVFVNENADPDVQRDLLAALARQVPDDADYRHAEGNSPAHIKAVLIGSDVTVAVAGGALALGRWQGIFLAEFDGPRQRRATITVIGERGG